MSKVITKVSNGRKVDEPFFANNSKEKKCGHWNSFLIWQTVGAQEDGGVLRWVHLVRDYADKRKVRQKTSNAYALTHSWPQEQWVVQLSSEKVIHNPQRKVLKRKYTLMGVYRWWLLSGSSSIHTHTHIHTMTDKTDRPKIRKSIYTQTNWN